MRTCARDSYGGGDFKMGVVARELVGINRGGDRVRSSGKINTFEENGLRIF